MGVRSWHFTHSSFLVSCLCLRTPPSKQDSLKAKRHGNIPHMMKLLANFIRNLFISLPHLFSRVDILSSQTKWSLTPFLHPPLHHQPLFNQNTSKIGMNHRLKSIISCEPNTVNFYRFNIINLPIFLILPNYL